MATIRDVAKVSGVSTATVSHVLHGRNDRVGAETRDRVLAAIRELRYRPTALERNQQTILSRNLAFMVQDLVESPLETLGYVRRALSGVFEVAGFRGWSVTLVAQKAWRASGTDHYIRSAFDGRADGAILIAPLPENELLQRLHERGMQICLLGTTPSLPGVSCVDLDNEAAARMVVRHFASLGHRRVGYVSSDSAVTSDQERQRGLLDAAKAADLAATVFRPRRMDRLTTVVDEWIALGSARPTALLAWNDGYARGLVNAFTARGFQVPQDLSIAGIDDAEESRAAEPTITTIGNPVEDLGRRAATMLIDRLETDPRSRDSASIHLPPVLHLRMSTAPPPNDL